MTGPAPAVANASPPPWWLTPRVAVPALLALLAGVSLLVPQAVGRRSGDPRVSVTNTGPLGGSLVGTLATRLGWSVVERRTQALPAGDSLVHVLLSPAVPLRGYEAEAVLNAVAAGAAAFVVASDGPDVLLDRLHVGLGRSGTHEKAVGTCPEDSTALPFARLWDDREASLWSLRVTGPFPEPAQVFVALEPGEDADSVRGATWGLIGIPHGKGRLVLAADPDVVRNDALRVCGYGLDVPVVRALEWLRDGGRVPRRTLVVDEFHQGFGAQPGTWGTIVAFLGRTGPGRLILGLGVAALVLLVARAPRLVPPRAVDRVERRSPMEHVDALARAYEQVRATRTVAHRLVAGLRRRLDGPAARRRGETDPQFLARVRERHPELAPDVDRLREAITHGVAPDDLPAVGDAIARLDTSLTR